MIINRAGLDLIKSFEGLRCNAYKCPAGVWTIGYGHTLNVVRGQIIDVITAEQLLKQDLQRFERAVDRLITVPLTDNQFSALVSFAFNCGETALSASTLRRKLNSGDYLGASLEFLRWTRANGKVLPGLVRRRNAEKQLFLKP
jgi:lysozyme